MLVDLHVPCAASRAQSQGPALLQAATETIAGGSTGKEDLKADRQVRHYKEVGLQEWPLAVSACLFFGERFFHKLRVPAPVDLTIHTFRTVDRTAGQRFAVVAHSGKR